MEIRKIVGNILLSGISALVVSTAILNSNDNNAHHKLSYFTSDGRPELYCEEYEYRSIDREARNNGVVYESTRLCFAENTFVIIKIFYGSKNNTLYARYFEFEKPLYAENCKVGNNDSICRELGF